MSNPENRGSFLPQPTKYERRVLRDELTNNVLELRGRYTYKEIAAALKISYATVSNIVHKKIIEGRVKPLDRVIEYAENSAGRRPYRGGRKGNSSEKFEKTLNEYALDHPNEPVNFSEIALRLGVTREAVRQQYKKLERTKAFPPTKRRLPREILDPAVRDLLAQGLDIKTIANELKIYTTDIRKAAARNRINQRNEFDRLCQSLRGRGHTNKEIEKITGKDRGTVQNAFKRLIKSGENVRIRKPRTPKQEVELRLEYILGLAEKGLSYTQIAQELNLDRFTVANSMTRLHREGRFPIKTSST